MSARDVFIELKERGSSARTGREQEPRCFELGGSKMEMADARLDGAFRAPARGWLQRMGTRRRVVLARTACAACITWTLFQLFPLHFACS